MGSRSRAARFPIPAPAGFGLRAAHMDAFLRDRPAVGWVEVHSENYFVAGGPHLADLERVRWDYPLSLHGVGLSMGSADELDAEHLRSLRRLINATEPMLVSEHLCWTSFGGAWFNDLLPLPYTDEALRHMISRVQQVQEYLGRRILVENLSSYLQFHGSEIPEWEFLADLARASGCGLLLDVNNVYVSARNHRFDAQRYLAALPVDAVQEIHLAGHSVQAVDGGEILVDTHDGPVAEPVWSLYRDARARFSAAPALIEWDQALPELDVLVAQAHRADHVDAEQRHASAA